MKSVLEASCLQVGVVPIQPRLEDMIKVKMLVSGEVVEVTRNEAHGLIDSGKAELYKGDSPKPKKKQSYKNRMMDSE